MFVSCPAARFHATSRTMCIYVYLCVSMCIYVYAYMYAICTRCVCGSAGTCTLSLSRQRGTSTHCMHAAARALSLFHSRGSAAAPGHVCISAATVCRTAARSSLSGFAFESGGLSRAARVCGPAVLRCCGPVVLRVCFVLSCCQRCMRHDLAPPMSAAVPAAALAAATREVALEAWRWRLGDGGLAMEAWRWRLGVGGLALEASWPVAVRRRPLVVALGAAWRGVARRGMWRGE